MDGVIGNIIKGFKIVVIFNDIVIIFIVDKIS